MRLCGFDWTTNEGRVGSNHACALEHGHAGVHECGGCNLVSERAAVGTLLTEPEKPHDALSDRALRIATACTEFAHGLRALGEEPLSDERECALEEMRATAIALKFEFEDLCPKILALK